MSGNNKKESSITANIAGVQAPGSKMPKREYISFDDLVGLLDVSNKDIEEIKEIVRKRGNQWIYYDDTTGTEKGIFRSREDAWKRQRWDRQVKRNKRKHKKKKSESPFEKKSSETKKEHLLKMFKESLKRVLSEGSSLSYVFEQSPLSNDSVEWENFLQKLSKQTILSDQKLRAILQNMAKSEIKLLVKSVAEIKSSLESNGNFSIEQKKADQDEAGDLILNFEVKMGENNKKLTFAVKIDNGRPLIQFPEKSKMELNAMANDESKLLRAGLMYVQETVLDNMDDVLSITQKRDEYLKSLQQKIDKILSDLPPLEIAIIKDLLKNKYRGIK